MTDQSLNTVLEERGGNYGSFKNNAVAAQQLKETFRGHLAKNDRYANLDSAAQCVVDEGLDLIALKLSRIITGDPLYKDNWIDIAGYATITNHHANEANK